MLCRCPFVGIEIGNDVTLCTLPRVQPYCTESCPSKLFDDKMTKENPDLLQALTNKGVNWVDLKRSEFVSKSFGNQ